MHPAFKFLARYVGSLRFGVMKIIDVYCLDAEILPAHLDLVLQILGRHHMAARHHLLRTKEAGIDQGPLEVFGGVFRLAAVEGQETAFGGEQHLVTLHVTGGNHACERLGDGTLTALVPVINCRVNDVDP